MRLADAYAKLAPGTPDLRINFGDAPPETIKGSDEEGDLNEFPIYVICMSPDASSSLEYALDAIPEEKKEDLVFLQRGDMIEPTLKKRGLARERQTQAVLYYGLNEFGKIEDDRCSALGRTPWASRSSRPSRASPVSGPGRWPIDVEGQDSSVRSFFIETGGGR